MKFSKQFSLYESEATGFLKSLKTANLSWSKASVTVALLWDKAPVDLETQKNNLESRVPQQACLPKQRLILSERPL
jgi:hypothetical protein